MKRWLMDIIVCPTPECRNTLNVEVFKSHTVEHEGETQEEIDEALITCPNCGRWYPVIDGIACMLPDNLRMKDKQRFSETKFLERWKDRIDPTILKSGKPFGISN